jgi:DNA helicase-4
MLEFFYNKLYGAILTRIQESVKEFEGLGVGRYIRHSDLERWKRTPRVSVPESILYKILEALRADKESESLVQKYRMILQQPDKAREKTNANYIHKSLELHRAFFDSVESNPLTDRQREACLIDEDFNLVLAGAGSGKTSVVVARAGLIERAGWANPDEILILAFGKKAAQETHERIQLRLGEDSQVLASTFHALGLNIIGKSKRRKPSLHKSSEDDDALLQLIDGFIDEFASQDRAYATDLLSYFRDFLCPVREPEQFETIGEYYEHLDALNLKTLKGEKVKSWQELHIANFLTMNSIPYAYEPRYEFDTADADYRQYQPDFRLTRSGAYIEHFGVNEAGQPNPKYTEAEKKAYLQGIVWKRSVHESKGTTLIETTSGDFETNRIWEKLEKELAQVGEKLDPMPVDSLLDLIRTETDAPKKLSYLIAHFINLQKNNRLGIEDVKRLTQQDPKSNKLMAALGFTPYLTARLQAFYRVYEPVYLKYEKTLVQAGCVDFNDMINEATDLVREGKFKPNWKFILVDEFQDISASRAELVKVLVEKGPRTSLFCVGDDWQSIYRFTGSDIRYTNEFRSRFGPSATTALDKTFRFNQEISGVATKFVTKNPTQQKKKISALTQLNQPAVSVHLHGDQDEDRAIKMALDRIIEDQTNGTTATVYLLGRFHFRAPDTLPELKTAYPTLDIRFETTHASKGKEADYVIVLGMNTERFGFPSEIDTDPIIELLLPPSEAFQHAEERRLFYVALTRARTRSFALADRSKYSSFIKELKEEFGNSVEFYDTEGTAWDQPCHCPICKSGKLILRDGACGNFFSCSNYPRCNYKENACPHCGSGPLLTSDSKAHCASCEVELQICPTCLQKGIIATLRASDGANGKFYGCSNFRGKEGHTCRYTKNAPVVSD